MRDVIAVGQGRCDQNILLSLMRQPAKKISQKTGPDRSNLLCFSRRRDHTQNIWVSAYLLGHIKGKESEVMALGKRS